MNEKCVVLLIKNNPRIFNICCKMLEQDGVKVVAADTFAEVIERVKGGSADTPPSASLTKKERMVATLAAAQFSNKEIAEQLYISESRVKTCLTGIYRKLGFSLDTENKRKELNTALDFGR